MAGKARAGVLRHALESCIEGDVTALSTIFTDDVSGWSPNMLVASLGELTETVADRDGSLSDVELQIHAIDVVGDKGYVEYSVSAVFSGPFVIDRDRVIEPNGNAIVLGAAMVAEFRGDKIAVFRNYFDDASLMEQMLFA